MSKAKTISEKEFADLKETADQVVEYLSPVIEFMRDVYSEANVDPVHPACIDALDKAEHAYSFARGLQNMIGKFALAS